MSPSCVRCTLRMSAAQVGAVFSRLPQEILAQIYFHTVLAGDEADAVVGPDDDVSLIYGRKSLTRRTSRALFDFAVFRRARAASGIAWVASGWKLLRWADMMQYDQKAAASLRHLIVTPSRTSLTAITLAASLVAMLLPSLKALATLEMSICNDAGGSIDVLFRAIGRLQRLRRLALSGPYPRRHEAWVVTNVTLSDLALALEAGRGTPGQSGIQCLVLDHLTISDGAGGRTLPVFNELTQLRLVDVADGDWKTVCELTNACDLLQTLEWTICNETDPTDEVLAGEIVEAFTDRLLIHSLIVGRGFNVSTVRDNRRNATRKVMDRVWPLMPTLRDVHIGHPALIAPSDLIARRGRLRELSVDISVARDVYGDYVSQDRGVFGFIAALSSVIPGLQHLTVMGCGDEGLRDVLQVRLRLVCARLSCRRSYAPFTASRARS